MTKFMRGNKGFTLIELMVVMIILAVLATIVTGGVMGTKSKSEDTSVKADAYNVQTAAQRFNNDSYKSNDWPEADTNKVAIVKVGTDIRVKYDTILMYDSDGSTALTVSTTSVTGEAVGTGDGANAIFYVLHTPVVGDSQTIKVAGVAKTEGAAADNYTFEDATGKITFGTAPVIDAAITADYQYHTGEPLTTLNWEAATKVRDSSGTLADRKLVPDFLSHKPANVVWTQGTKAVYAWVMLKGSSLDSTETRSVEIFKLNADSDKYIKIYPE